MHMRNTVEDIRQHFKDLLRHKVFVTDKTGVKMLEIVGANFVADEKAIFGNVNYDYVERELDWYKSKSLSVNDIPGGPPAIWKQVADKDGYINSNYGWCIWSIDNNFQYQNVYDELKNNPESRRATMIYTRPTMWKDYNHNGRSDFMCTNAVQYMFRNNALHAIVQMRSNDVVFGYKNDYAWQSYVLDCLCLDLGVQRGDIHWNVGSLHVYERHFDLVK
jgi:thymidylate synthase